VNDGPENRVQLTLPSNPRFMTLLRSIVTQSAKLVGFDADQTQEIVLAVDEACTNIIRHCYRGDPTQTIVVYVDIEDGALGISLRDFGQQKDPSQFKSRDLDEIEPGGLGMHFIQSTMDVVEYDTTVSVGTLMRMKKFVNPVTQGSPDGDHQE